VFLKAERKHKHGNEGLLLNHHHLSLGSDPSIDFFEPISLFDGLPNQKLNRSSFTLCFLLSALYIQVVTLIGAHYLYSICFTTEAICQSIPIRLYPYVSHKQKNNNK